METNDYSEDEEINIPQGVGTVHPTRKEKVRKKAMEIMKIIGSVVGHQLKITLLISAIFLIITTLLCASALYILDQNNIEGILKTLAM